MELNRSSIHRLATVATDRSYRRQTVESLRKRYVHSASPNPGPVWNIVAATKEFRIFSTASGWEDADVSRSIPVLAPTTGNSYLLLTYSNDRVRWHSISRCETGHLEVQIRGARSGSFKVCSPTRGLKPARHFMLAGGRSRLIILPLWRDGVAIFESRLPTPNHETLTIAAHCKMSRRH